VAILPTTRESPTKQSTYRMTDRADWTADNACAVDTTPASAVIQSVAFTGLHRRSAFLRQRPVLGDVEESGLGVAMLVLPAGDGCAGRIVELSADLGFVPEPGQIALHLATLRLGEAHLILGLLSRLGCRICGCLRFARDSAQTGFGASYAGEDSYD